MWGDFIGCNTLSDAYMYFYANDYVKCLQYTAFPSCNMWYGMAFRIANR